MKTKTTKILTKAITKHYDEAWEQIKFKGIAHTTHNMFVEIARIWHKNVMVASAKRNR